MPAFRFDFDDHTYVDLESGQVLPHITGMLEQTGWIDDTWMTEESSARGAVVHTLAADYDLGALDLRTCASPCRPYLLAHIACSKALRPVWQAIEEPLVHWGYRFGGRPDRLGKVLGLHTVLEVKSGAPLRGHGVQTALQAVLASSTTPSLPPHLWQRMALYLKPNGTFKLEKHTDRRDVDEALRVIRRCCQ
jgi:hypothetical protein